MIKAYSVRYDEDKMTIDAHLRIDKEIEQKKKTMITIGPKDFSNDGEFTQGIQAVLVEKLPSPEEIEDKTSVILEDAREQAKNLIEQAKKEAEKIKNDAYATAQKKGYDDGLQQGSRQIQKQAADYEAKARQLQKEYDSSVIELEPKIAEIMAALIEKITGLLVEDKKEVILHLVSRALRNMDKLNEYTIRVSPVDYEYVSERKNLLHSAIGREASIDIVEDTGFIKNQCLIETDLKVIDCSLDVQLKNLITDLKLLGGV
jgi:flagellar assembly protein FliH